MPCCALAAFIVGQIVIGFDAFKRFVFGRSPADEEIRNNPATEWLLFARAGHPEAGAAPLRPARAGLSLRWLAIAGALEITLAMGAVYGLRAHHQNDSSRAAAVECRRGAFWQSK